MKPCAHTRFTKAQRADILRRWRNGERLRAMAEEFDLSVSRVWALKQLALVDEARETARRERENDKP